MGGRSLPGPFSSPKALPLEHGITVGVLDQEPGRVRPVVARKRLPRPPDLGYHLLEPGHQDRGLIAPMPLAYRARCSD
jgi:hypothetical protein